MLKESFYAYADKKYYTKFNALNKKLKDSPHYKKFLWHKSYYVNDETELRVCCKSHGFFKILPHKAVSSRLKCPYCIEQQKKKHKLAVNARRKYRKQKNLQNLNKGITTKPSLTTEEFIARAKKIHKDRYTYENTNYISARLPIIITCPIHGDFKSPRALDHYINGTGCPKCSRGGFNSNLPAIVYYISINNGEAYKIGITNGSIVTRYASEDRKKIKLLYTWYFKNGQDARNLEREIIKEFSYVKYNGPQLFKYTKTTEMFSEDILKFLI